MTDPFAYEEHRKKKIQEKIEESRQSRVKVQVNYCWIFLQCRKSISATLFFFLPPHHFVLCTKLWWFSVIMIITSSVTYRTCTSSLVCGNYQSWLTKHHGVLSKMSHVQSWFSDFFGFWDSWSKWGFLLFIQCVLLYGVCLGRLGEGCRSIQFSVLGVSSKPDSLLIGSIILPCRNYLKSIVLWLRSCWNKMKRTRPWRRRWRLY